MSNAGFVTTFSLATGCSDSLLVSLPSRRYLLRCRCPPLPRMIFSSFLSKSSERKQRVQCSSHREQRTSSAREDWCRSSVFLICPQSVETSFPSHSQTSFGHPSAALPPLWVPKPRRVLVAGKRAGRRCTGEELPSTSDFSLRSHLKKDEHIN